MWHHMLTYVSTYVLTYVSTYVSTNVHEHNMNITWTWSWTWSWTWKHDGNLSCSHLLSQWNLRFLQGWKRVLRCEAPPNNTVVITKLFTAPPSPFFEWRWKWHSIPFFFFAKSQKSLNEWRRMLHSQKRKIGIRGVCQWKGVFHSLFPFLLFLQRSMEECEKYEKFRNIPTDPEPEKQQSVSEGRN